MSDFADQMLEFIRSKAGKPYIWAGRGDFYVDGKGVVHQMVDAGCDEGFDCAGLIDCAAKYAKSMADLRGWWGANHFFHLLPEPGPTERYKLRLYGEPTHVDAAGLTVPGRAWHVTFDMANGTMWEAAGGDHTTLNAEIARRIGAKVQLSPVRQKHFLGFRSVDALQKAPKIPPRIP